MRLSALLEGVPGVDLSGDGTREVREVCDDSRVVAGGDLFVAMAGTKQDGRRFVADALARGAAAVMVEVSDGDGDAVARAVSAAGATLVRAGNVRRALGVVAANRFGAARALALTGVTGTSGKTTVTYLVEAILVAAGRRPGVLGTVSYRYPGRVQPAALTTPGALELHAFFAEMQAGGCTDAVLETSSHALDQGRLHGCRFRVAALTNVTQDHLDYHLTPQAYFAAKEILFRELLAYGATAVLLNDRDDGRRMRAAVPGRVLTVASTPGAAADVSVRARHMGAQGTEAVLDTPGGPVEIATSLVGEFNLTNVALAAGIGIAHGLPASAIARGIAALSGVPGRLEPVPNQAGVVCLVDYAHKPDALERVLAVVRAVTPGRVVLVFGCGGDRDHSKRPIMGEAAGRGADVVLVTSDNPRTEDPRAIIEEILPGLRRAGAREHTAEELAAGARGHCVQMDRRAAIRAAAAIARPGDTLLVAGKGHEDYQILGTTKIHFDDREECAAALRTAGGAP